MMPRKRKHNKFELFQDPESDNKEPKRKKKSEVIFIESSDSDGEREYKFDENKPPETGTDRIIRTNKSREEEEAEERERLIEKQLADESWLRRVIGRLQALSNPIEEQKTLADTFLELKKQWGYIELHEQVEPDNCNCTLCDHEGVAYLFIIKNKENGKETSAASNCIFQFRVLNTVTNQLLEKDESQHIIKEAVETAIEERKAILKAKNYCKFG